MAEIASTVRSGTAAYARMQSQGVAWGPMRYALVSPQGLRGPGLAVLVVALQGSPLGRPFGVFVDQARVTMLGLVPSIARAWRASNCMQVGRYLLRGPG